MSHLRHSLRILLFVALALPAPATASRLVSYGRTGGFIGESTSLVVKRDRHATRDSRQGTDDFTLSRTRYRSLRAALRAARFRHLDAQYGSDNVADGYDEAITFIGVTVHVYSDGSPPARLEKVLTKLRDLSQ